MRAGLKRSLGWVEAGLYLGGLGLLAAFALALLEGERQREAGIDAFHAAPDLSLWDAQRIRAYESSLAVEAAPPLAVLNIGRLGIEVPVYDGADDFNLNRGVARIAGTAAVDAAGNLGIAGHRDGFFRALKDVEIGDRIELFTGQGARNYSVSSIDIVDPQDVGVLAPTEATTVTLVTCYPFYYVGHAPKRYIVKAIAEHSLDVH
jgi:sortase A